MPGAIVAGLKGYATVDWRFGDLPYGGPIDWLDALGIVLLPVLTAGSFLPLTRTFGRMRLRRVHLVRGAAYWYASVAIGVGFWALMWLYFRVAATWWTLPRGLANALDQLGPIVAGWIIGAAWLVWHVVYWWSFSKRYLRVPHAFGVAAAAMATGLLADLALCVLVFVAAVAVIV